MQGEYRVHFNLAPAEIHVGVAIAQDPAEAYELAIAQLDEPLADIARQASRSCVQIERVDEKGGSA